MKVFTRNIVRISLCTGLLLGTVSLGSAQEPASQQAAPAADNALVNSGC